MNKYRYKARDRAGNVVTGEVEATSESSAAKLVRERGYILVDLKKGSTLFASLNNIKSNISRGDVAAFTRQLSTMINAGLPVDESLSILKLQSKAALQNVATQILADVEGG